MLLLSIDTSTTICSVALHQDSRLLGCYELFTERTSSAMLTSLVDNVVRQAGYSLPELDAIAVAKGPGSYTGLRIGVSTAKGLCFALDKPLIAINTLQAMTEQVRQSIPLALRSASLAFCPMLDARRMEVYCALYDSAGNELMPTSARIIDEMSFVEELATQPILFFGDGATKCRPILGSQTHAIFSSLAINPSARTIGQLGESAFIQGDFEDIADFEPFYLKDFMTTKPKNKVL